MPLKLETIVAAFEDTVRFDQSINPEVDALDATLTTPSTARLVHHSLLTDENLFSIAPNFAKFTPAPTPTLDNSFSDWLADKRKEAIRSVVMDSYNSRRRNGNERMFLQDRAVYNGSGSLSNRIINEGKLVGFEIEVLNSNSLEVILTRISTQLDSLPGSFDLHLFHTDFDDSIAQITILPTVPISIEWTSIPEVDGTLKFNDPTAGIYGGRYFLMYYQDDLGSSQFINKEMNFGVTPCSSCNRYNYETHKIMSRYVRLRSVWVAANDVPVAGKMFDLKKLQYSTNKNWGMNLAFTSGCDLTDYILERKNVFGDAIANQLEADLLQELNNTTRTNSISEKVRENARFALQDRRLGGEGVLSRLQASKESLMTELGDVEKNVCSPEVATRTIKYGSI